MAHADRAPSIMLDGVTIDQKAGAPAENTGKTVMVPIRIVSENLGYDVKWEQATQTVQVRRGSSIIEMTAGKDAATVNGNIVNLDAPPLIKQGTTLVPLRFVGEGMGLQVGWDNGTKTVSLVSIPPVVNTEPDSDPVETPVPVGLTELQSISYSGDRLIVATNGNISPKVSNISGPERIIVDLPNTTSHRHLCKDRLPIPMEVARSLSRIHPWFPKSGLPCSASRLRRCESFWI